MRIKLVDGYHTHDYLITVEQLREMRLSVSTNVPSEVYELVILIHRHVQINWTSDN